MKTNHAPDNGHKTSIVDMLLGFKLRMAQIYFFEAFFDAFDAENITPAGFAILDRLSDHPDIKQGELGASLHIKRSNMSKVMRALEERGLIQRTADPEDKRAFNVRLSNEGRGFYQKLKSKMSTHDLHVARRLSDSERAQLMGLLKKLVTGNENISAPKNTHEKALKQLEAQND